MYKSHKYRIREYSPIWWAMTVIGIAVFITFMSIPSSVEF